MAPRDGSGVYSTPPGTHGIPDTTILSTPYNANVDDVAQDLNTPRPIVAGGTGATTPAQAMINLGGIPVTGGIMTGDLSIKPTSGDATLWLEKPTATDQNTIYGAYVGHARWSVSLGNNEPETGGNAGSNFDLGAFADNGTFLGTPIHINRGDFTTTLKGETFFRQHVHINDTTGPNLLLDNLGGGVASYVLFAKNSNAQWALTTSGDFNSLSFARFNSSGVFIDFPLAFDKTTGAATFSQPVIFKQTTSFQQTPSIAGAGNSVLEMNKPGASTFGNLIMGKAGGAERWRVYLGDFSGESGSNVGSDFSIERFSDAGVSLGTALKIVRSTGATTFNQSVAISYADPTLSLNTAAAGHAATILGTKNFVGRWFIQLGDSTAEGGSNTGSNFVIGRQSDAGSLLDVPFSINRGDASIRVNGAANTYGSKVCVLSTASLSHALECNTVDRGIVNITTAASGYANIFFQGTAIVGSITVTTTNAAFNTTSDARRKEDLKPFDGGAIIDAIATYDFLWKGTDRRGHGVLAQEVHEVYPEATDYNAKDDVWGVDYSKFVPLLLAEIKALRVRVAALEGK